MSILEELTNKRTRMVADLSVIEQAIKALAPVLGNGHVNGDTKREEHRANISAGLRKAWARRKAAKTVTSTQETQ